MPRKRPIIFHESGLEFTFNQEWLMRKYDEHNFYRGLSSAGLKAVDFIGFNNGHAVFIEVKNYKQRSPRKAIEILSDPLPFINRMLQKVEDSRRGIRAIHQFYERNSLYRKLFPVLLKLKLKSWSRASWLFWAQLYHAVWEKKELEIIFWLEFKEGYDGISETQYQKAMNDIQQHLKTELIKQDFNVRFSSSAISPKGINIITV